MTIDYKIRDEKLQYDIDGKASVIPTFSSGKIYKYEYLTGEEILCPDESRMIEKATCYPLNKVSEKQIKTIESLKVLKPDLQQLRIKGALLQISKS